ncbi:hypothetical protein [Enterococcus faecium]|uniref:hypothetical protein n=1 Tax=Enterococcus faecium TaxID=1352 RepID=UPI0001CEB168|nr:hypothetical protein EfmE1636_2745 [Enterococcus faecium E1636]
MFQLAGIQTGKIYYSGKSKSEISQWLLKTFTNNQKLKRLYPNNFFKNDQIMPEPMLLIFKEDKR